MGLSSLSALKDLATAAPAAAKAGCNCSARAKKANDLAVYRPMFEAAMAMLSPDEKESFKSILNVKKVCYFIKDNKGQIKKHCF